MVGLDGYDYRWASYFERYGYECEALFSPVPVSPPAWTTLATGMLSKDHGILGYHKFIESLREKEPVAPTFWDRANEHGKTCVVVNWPFLTYRHNADRLLVRGWPSDPADYVRPKGVARSDQWVLEELDIVHTRTNSPTILATPNDELLQRAYRNITVLSQKFTEECMADPVDLAIVCHHDLDRLTHFAYDAMADPKLLNRLLVHLSDTVHTMEKELKPEAVIIFSDHGLNVKHPPEEPGGRAQGHFGIPDCQDGAFFYKGIEKPEVIAQETVANIVLDALGIGESVRVTDQLKAMGYLS
jgi:hypothetical protein